MSKTTTAERWTAKRRTGWVLAAAGAVTLGSGELHAQPAPDGEARAAPQTRSSDAGPEVTVRVVPDVTDRTRCIPGAQVECACPVGASGGVQQCSADGKRFSACACTPQPATLTYDERSPIPDGYRLEERARKTWIEAGLGVAGSLYLASGLIASLIDAGGTNETSHRYLYIPAVGPFITAATPPDAQEDTWTFLVVADGVLQTAGLVTAIWALTSPEPVLVRTAGSGARDGRGREPNGVTVSMVPIPVQSGMGMGLAGRM